MGFELRYNTERLGISFKVPAVCRQFLQPLLGYMAEGRVAEIVS